MNVYRECKTVCLKYMTDRYNLSVDKKIGLEILVRFVKAQVGLKPHKSTM